MPIFGSGDIDLDKVTLHNVGQLVKFSAKVHGLVPNPSYASGAELISPPSSGGSASCAEESSARRCLSPMTFSFGGTGVSKKQRTTAPGMGTNPHLQEAAMHLEIPQVMKKVVAFLQDIVKVEVS